MKTAWVKKAYSKRIRTILRNIRNTINAELRGTGITAKGPYDFSVDDYRWELVVEHNGESSASISITIAESEYYDGTQGGINFSLDVIGDGGEIIVGLTPYNYTPLCWVPLKDGRKRNSGEIEDRFQLFESADFDSIPESIRRFLKA